jgi:hypothetical protein
VDTKFYTAPLFYGPHYYPQQVISRMPLFYCSPMSHDFGQPVRDWECVDGKMVQGPHKHLAVLTCGHTHSKDGTIGETVHCEECVHEQRALYVLRDALAKGVVSHSRANADGRDQLNGFITVYRREPTSPTGVYSLCSMRETAETRALLTGSQSPLSPTEGR